MRNSCSGRLSSRFRGLLEPDWYIRFSSCPSNRLGDLDWFGDGLSDRLDERSGLRNWLLVNRPDSRLLNGRLLVRFVRGRLLIRVSRLSSGLRWLGCGRKWPVLVLLPRLDCSDRRFGDRRLGNRRLSDRRLGRRGFGRPTAPVLSRRLFLLARWLFLLAWWLVLLSRRLMLLPRSGGRISRSTTPVLLSWRLLLLAWWLFLLARRLLLLAWSGGRIGRPTAPVSGVFGIRLAVLGPSIGLLGGGLSVRLSAASLLVSRRVTGVGRFIWLLRLSLSTPKK